MCAPNRFGSTSETRTCSGDPVGVQRTTPRLAVGGCAAETARDLQDLPVVALTRLLRRRRSHTANIRSLIRCKQKGCEHVWAMPGTLSSDTRCRTLSKRAHEGRRLRNDRRPSWLRAERMGSSRPAPIDARHPQQVDLQQNSHDRSGLEAPQEPWTQYRWAGWHHRREAWCGSTTHGRSRSLPPPK